MNLEIFNKLMDNAKENNPVQEFIKELSEFLEKASEKTMQVNKNRQENCLYQVVEIGTNYAYLQNTNTNIVFKENDIDKEVLGKLNNDEILRYKNGKYIIEEELTQKFFDSLVGIKEYKKIQENFIKESNILEHDPNTRYKIENREKDYTILKYENGTIKVPNALVPFFANNESILYYNYENKTFNREMNKNTDEQ